MGQALQEVAFWAEQAVQGYWHWVQVFWALRKKPGLQERQEEGVAGAQGEQGLAAAQGRQLVALGTR